MKPPALAPPTPQTVWIDLETRSDTVITNVDNQAPVIYYALKNWQLLPDTSISHGYRFIAVRFNDSIYVKPLNDLSTNYTGPFILQASNGNETLKAQNFIDSASTKPPRIFIQSH